MKKKCDSCKQDIPEGRLKALPNATKCVNCSDTNKVKAIIVTNGNTIEEVYETLQIIEDQDILKNIHNISNTYTRTLSECADSDSLVESDDMSSLSIKDAIKLTETEEILNDSMLVENNMLEITDRDFIEEEETEQSEEPKEEDESEEAW
jgi:uncharacterized protein (DUF1499 family)